MVQDPQHTDINNQIYSKMYLLRWSGTASSQDNITEHNDSLKAIHLGVEETKFSQGAHIKKKNNKHGYRSVKAIDNRNIKRSIKRYLARQLHRKPNDNKLRHLQALGAQELMHNRKLF